MVYLINGEKSLIDKEVNDLIKKYNTTSIIKYDLVFNKISDVINDINTVNLFSDKKVIICSSINNIDNIDILVKYLDNQNDNILILTNEDKIDLKILNKIKNKKIEKIDVSNIDLTSFIKEEFKDYKISFKEINMLKDYTSNDYNRIKEEIIKFTKDFDLNVAKETIVLLLLPYTISCLICMFIIDLKMDASQMILLKHKKSLDMALNDNIDIYFLQFHYGQYIQYEVDDNLIKEYSQRVNGEIEQYLEKSK